VLSAALQGGQSSRLYQALVRDKQLAQAVNGFADEKRGTGAFYTSATVRSGVKPADVEAVIYDEIERIKKDGNADWELQKAKNTTRRGFINSMQSSLSRALNIAVWTVYYNDPNLINTRLDKVMAVTKADVQRVANKYLVTTNRTVVVTIPKPKTTAAATRQ
jgi:predicted Zn-dependent peptidase